jgi:hypothetical protein
MDSGSSTTPTHSFFFCFAGLGSIILVSVWKTVADVARKLPMPRLTVQGGNGGGCMSSNKMCPPGPTSNSMYPSLPEINNSETCESRSAGNTETT